MMSLSVLLVLVLVCLLIPIEAAAPRDVDPIATVNITLYSDSGCAHEAVPSSLLSILDPNDRCGACITDPATSPVSSARLICAQTASDTQLHVTTWADGDCSGNATVVIIGNAHMNDPNGNNIRSLCMPVTVSLSAMNLTLSYYATADCGDDAPVPAAQPQCSLSKQLQWIIIGASVGLGLLLISLIACCCYYSARKRAAQRAQLAHYNPGLARGILIEQPTSNYYQPQYGYTVQAPVSQPHQYVRM